MLDYTDFDRVFGPLKPFPYNGPKIQQVEVNRRPLQGALFIDRVLKALQLSQAATNYPPKNEKALRNLHEQVCENNNTTIHHKLSIIYYLLLDIDVRIPGGSQKAEYFASTAGIPPKYSLFMRGLWYMDNLYYEAALEYLTHPSMLSEFADDIITVLVHASKNGDFTLPLAYYYTVRPNIQSSAALELLFDALAQSSVPEAFDFTRSHAETMRQQLFQRLVLTVLGSARDEESAEKAFELTSLPFDADEERWFRECLTSGEGKRLRAAKDTLLMRRIATGNAAAVSGEKGTWAVVLEGFKKGSGGRTLA
ncbi:nuclear pore complex assembly-domain-containing protein [Xylariomycetidae sp. FL0641]|nr:nuclear pore complex assembly-domain-containing protein [Xylariomycetidae sp. FL0641]